MAEVTLQLTALNRGSKSDIQGVYPWSSLPTNETFGGNKYIAKFADAPSTYNNKKISGIKIYFYAYPQTGWGGATYVSDIRCQHRTHSWDPTTWNYSQATIGFTNSFKTNSFNGAYWQWTYANCSNYLNRAKSILLYGLEFLGSTVETNAQFVTKGANAPYIVATFSDADNKLTISTCSPNGGYQAKGQSCIFNWSCIKDGDSIVDPTVSSSKFRWRTSSSASATEIDCGTALTYTMPANTVSTDSFQWQAEITDSNGNTSTSAWYTISTLEALSTAEIIEPKNIAIDGSKETRFAWNHIISTGTAQTAAELQQSTNGTTWSTLANVSGSNNYVDIPANTFPSGNRLWRVRTYNTDNNAGEWASASISIVAAPSAPTVTSEQNPRPTLRWQSEEQQAYRVVIDNLFDSGPMFGVDNTYKLPIYLDDGTYTVKVSVQNEYGLWSNYGTAPITVVNTPGNAITLTSSMGTSSIELSWNSSGYSSYLVYRDGILIAKTGSKKYTDLTAVGEHIYYIRGIYAATSNYGKSNELEVNISVDVLTIVDLATGEDMQIETTDSSFAQISISETNIYAMTHITSSDYPLLEKSRYKEKNISFDCAFKLGDSRIPKFESLFARDVCIKTPSGTAVIGNILENNKVENVFYAAYQCSVLQIAWDEVISID